MSFTKNQKKTAEVFAPDYPTDYRNAWVKSYIKTNNLTQKQYKQIVLNEMKSNKKLIDDLYKTDRNREAQERFREKNKQQRYVGSINVEMVFERKKSCFF